MTRLLFWLILIVLVVLAWRSKTRAARPGPRPFEPRDAAAAAGAARASETMVSCAQCGLYIPEHEAATEGGKSFCCEQHRRLHFSRS